MVWSSCGHILLRERSGPHLKAACITDIVRMHSFTKQWHYINFKTTSSQASLYCFDFPTLDHLLLFMSEISHFLWNLLVSSILLDVFFLLLLYMYSSSVKQNWTKRNEYTGRVLLLYVLLSASKPPAGNRGEKKTLGLWRHKSCTWEPTISCYLRWNRCYVKVWTDKPIAHHLS